MNIHEEFKDLSTTTFCMLMNLKLLKSDYKSALAVKGEWIDFPSTKRMYTDIEKKRIVFMAERKYNEHLRYFKSVWKARRRLQKLILNVN